MPYHIEIDISKFKHNCFIATDSNVKVKDFIFTNDKAGFNLLLEELKPLGDPTKIKVGIESTGHYGANLKHFLVQSGYTFMEFNPYLTNQFSKALSLNNAKTDKIDAEVISKYLGLVDYDNLHIRFYHANDLKELVRLRNNYIEERSKELVHLTNVLDKMFPEFKPFFNNIFGHTALFILKTYTSKAKIAKLNKTHFDKLNSLSRGKFTYAKFNQLKQLAETSIGIDSIQFEFIIRLSIKHLDDLNTLLDELDYQIENLYQQTDSKLSSIPGLGIISAATIYAEIGNIKNFSSPEKLISHAGLKMRIIQSGTMNRTGKLVKRGSSLLRKTIWNYAFLSLRFLPTINDYYHKKKLEDKHHKVVLTHVCRKLLRMIYHIEFNNVTYDSNNFK
ncbi:MAG: IS110 family transposase [Acholeplasma sp.]|nr:IS110 family transposase [Acholeplasma sp.]